MTKLTCQVCGNSIGPENLGYINTDGGMTVECRSCHTAPRRIPKDPIKSWKVGRMPRIPEL